MRRTTKPVLAALLTAGLVATLAMSATAAVGTKSVKKFCQKAVEVQTALDEGARGLTEDQYPDYAADTEKGLKKLVKLAPTKKVRKALKTTAAYYGKIADRGDPNGVPYGQNQISAITTLTDYVTQKCVPLGITPTT